MIATHPVQIELQIAEAYQQMYSAEEAYVSSELVSGWNLKVIEDLTIHAGEYHPLMGSSYIPLPKEILLKKAVVNVQNEDNKCFIWSCNRRSTQNRQTILKE